uniref:Protein SET n=1 Tax=Aegilops tauschii subsp. strangulata TaxID=200361 RepID=A0A453NXB3_AEGTS
MTAPADKGKKAKTDTDVGEENEQIDGALVLSIERLQEIQDELEKVNEEASDKVLEVEQKYSEIRRPVYLRRCDIIKTIPDFWLTAFLSHPLLSELLTEEDQKRCSSTWNLLMLMTLKMSSQATPSLLTSLRIRTLKTESLPSHMPLLMMEQPQ